ncbi:hypothetical protein HDU83_005623 [Entophlyctis luteolus]|nr:hypothetical protein HDU83_005623 [Entophlyctis luteolus]KAJ3388161.1 hypothetical protein HDU84_000241 [Entophlyctis sp. JEL0112]
MVGRVNENPDWFLPLAIINGSMAGISILQLLFLLSFIWHNEAASNKSVITPFNVTLILMSLAIILIYITSFFMFTLPSPPLYLEVVIVFGSVSYEYFYLRYSYARSSPILSDVYPGMVRPVSNLLRVQPLIFVLTPVFDWISFYTDSTNPHLSQTAFIIANSLGFLGGSFTVTVDVILLTAFIQFLRKTTVDISATDTKFLTIARYGIVSIIFALGALTFFLPYFVLSLQRYYTMINVMFSCVGTTMVAMKVELFYVELEMTSVRKATSLGMLAKAYLQQEEGK